MRKDVLLPEHVGEVKKRGAGADAEHLCRCNTKRLVVTSAQAAAEREPDAVRRTDR